MHTCIPTHQNQVHIDDLSRNFALNTANGIKIKAYYRNVENAADDRELALVVAHELAHNTMGHRGKKTANATVGLLVDLLGAAAGVNTRGTFSDIGARAFSQDFEREADHVGMYYLARAGYPTEGVADFWRRMATEHPSSIRTNHSATHPPTTERFLALELSLIHI